jgi:hypothetical protein
MVGAQTLDERGDVTHGLQNPKMRRSWLGHRTRDERGDIRTRDERGDIRITKPIRYQFSISQKKNDGLMKPGQTGIPGFRETVPVFNSFSNSSRGTYAHPRRQTKHLVQIVSTIQADI